MRIGLMLDYGRPMAELATEVAEYEAAGLESVTVGEAYTFDAVSQLGYLAARTRTVELATGILPLFSRTPTMTAMTAAGLDYASDGRFRLGIGASGPQVIEGFHGVLYDAPLGRTRETVDVCRAVWRREKVVHQGRRYQVPLPAGVGSGEGKPLKLINRPVRDRIPITIAGTGPRNAALAAEVAEGWEPIFFHPGRAAAVWGEALAEGRAKRAEELGSLDIVVRVPTAIGDDVAHLEGAVRAQLALYIGGMGSRGKNFYNDLAVRYGYPEQARVIQDLFLSGKAAEAAAAVPQELVDATSLVGPRGAVAERLAAFAEAGVTLVNLSPLAPDHSTRLRDIETLRDLAG
ncbi:LLM class F420-dependent oxidoreductase [Pseudonocardia pini]|uniref:LLM class F420-dependent oxidoreductase n=1 Tax=Pseudonocardia pini TaxID=2758030 RepID=UPI0015F03EF1|nr:LLM class F420-dependent oxidoreductase [Pseudonocardia pini]